MAKYANIPSVPPAHPILKNGIAFSADPMNFIAKNNQELGDIYRISFGISDLLFLSHPDDVQHILQKNHKNYTKSKGYKVLGRSIGYGLLTSEGEYWKRNRRIAQPAFYKDSLNKLAQTMQETTLELIAEWKVKSETGEPFILLDEMMSLTCDIVSKCLFSSDIKSDTKVIQSSVSVLIDSAMPLMTNPLKVPVWIPTKFNRRLNKALNKIDEIIFRIIKERRKEKEAKRFDLLDMLMHTYDEESGARMTDQQLRDEAIILFLAGHETSANALSFAFHELESHPEEREALMKESSSAMKDGQLDLSKLRQLTYTKQIIDETLRMYPPAWVIGRKSKETDELNGKTIDKGQNLLFSPYFLHRDPRFWEEPNSFKPSRFTKEKVVQQHNYQFVPFGGGPRLCVGNNFAYMEIQIVLSLIYQHFNIELLEKNLELKPALTLRPKKGVPIKVSKK